LRRPDDPGGLKMAVHAPMAKIAPALLEMGHCQHCFNSFGVWACRDAEHLTPCLRCGAVKQGDL
jgi:hypothetical protein